MKPRHNYLEWQDTHKREDIPTAEVCHMFHLFHNTRWDGKRIFFVQRLAPHTFKVTHVLGMVAIFHLEPICAVQPQPQPQEEVHA